MSLGSGVEKKFKKEILMGLLQVFGLIKIKNIIRSICWIRQKVHHLQHPASHSVQPNALCILDALFSTLFVEDITLRDFIALFLTIT